jgi:nitrogenase molybdenum-iron protein beta chain
VILNEIVFGGEERLLEQIVSTLELMDGDLYPVVSGCMTEMIGDDIRAVVGSLDLGDKPVLALPTPSFKGNSYDGYDVAVKGLLKYYWDKGDPKGSGKGSGKGKKERGLINIFGVVPGLDVFYKGNLRELTRILMALGLKVNSFFGEGEDLRAFARASRAELSLLLSPVAGESSAEFLKKERGIPYLSLPLPIGAKGTREFIQRVSEALSLPKDRARKVIASEENIYYDYFERASDVYNDADLQRYAVIVTDAAYALSLPRFLERELGFIPVLTVVTDPISQEKKEALERSFYGGSLDDKRSILRFESKTAEIRKFLLEDYPLSGKARYFDGLSPGLVLGSVYERELAENYGLPLVTLSFPATNRVVFRETRAGYEGGLSLASEIFTTLVSGR